MTILPVSEGQIPFSYPALKRKCSTYYKLIGDLTATDQAPVICLHGGPGAGHEYLVPFGQVWADKKIPVILYDQIGSAQSTHLRETRGDESLWQEDIFLQQFWSVVEHFNLKRYHILGHSWGAGIGAALASSNPAGLQGLVLLSGLVSEEIAGESLHKLVYELPTEMRDVFIKHDNGQEYDPKDYSAAMEYFYKKHAYRDEPFPGEYMAQAMKNFAEDDTVMSTAIGPKFMTCTGSLKDWTVMPRLPKIEASTLLINGEYDYAPVEAFFEGIRKVKWLKIMGGAHMCFLEKAGKDKVMKAVGDFLYQKPTAE